VRRAKEDGEGGDLLRQPVAADRDRAAEVVLERREHARVDQGRRERVRRHAERRVLACDRLRERHHARLGGRVAGERWRRCAGAVDAGARPDDDDPPVAGLAHAGQDAAGAEERPGQVDVEHALPLGEAVLLERRLVQDSRREHSELRRSQPLLDLAEGGVDALLVADVGGDADHALDLLRRDVQRGDSRAEIAEGLDHAAADPPRAARDDGDSPVDSL
jgi:hypothetical protein